MSRPDYILGASVTMQINAYFYHLSFPFGNLLDYEKKKTTNRSQNGIRWSPWTQQEDLDFTDDIALILHTHHQMQKKINKISVISDQT